MGLFAYSPVSFVGLFSYLGLFSTWLATMRRGRGRDPTWKCMCVREKVWVCDRESVGVWVEVMKVSRVLFDRPHYYRSLYIFTGLFPFSFVGLFSCLILFPPCFATMHRVKFRMRRI